MADLSNRIAHLSPEQRALLERRLKSGAAGRAAPIAVVGMGCRFPGGADSPAAFWELLRQGVDAITEVPPDRWDVDALYDPDFSARGKTSTRWGGFIGGVDQFDPSFWGISPREASRMDPQQRIFLEVAWEALEDAGQPIDRLAGSRTGVFVGVHSQSSDYMWLQFADPSRIDALTATGTALNCINGRLSYLLDLQGPSLAVDTACSSSLVAVHLACLSLRAGECKLAVVGGVNLILSPHSTMAASRMQMLAADGRCKTFDARADGFVRGEGCGVVVLKPLADALNDGDPVLAVIRGSAVNQDGHTNGLTAPNTLSQKAVLQQALESAGVDAAQVTYVEAHGTGTSLGDPIEMEALAEVVGRPRPSGPPCLVGSVKTNIGHLEGAAGIAGLIKVVLALRHGLIPQNRHFSRLNPHINLEGTPLLIPTEVRPWPDVERRYAGLSSFGFSGTNAHVVLEEAPRPVAPARAVEPEAEASDRAWLLPLSARSDESLAALAGAYAELVSGASRPSLRDLCYSASVRRIHHDHRLAVVGRSADEITRRLRAFVAGEAASGWTAGRRDPNARRGLAFVFSGQGSQWFGMGRELLVHEPVFRSAVEECDRLLSNHAAWSLLGELSAEESRSRIFETEVAQPAIFALQIGLARLLRSWGIVPDAVVGHSAGEVAAAHVAGALSLEDAVRLVFHRGSIMQRATGLGSMVAVELPEHEARRAIAGVEDRVSVAAVNSPTATVLSGETAALEAVVRVLQSRGVPTRDLGVKYAFHSQQMEALQPDLSAALRDIQPGATSIRFVSTITGAASDGRDLDAAHWSRGIRQPVRFAAAIDLLAREGHDLFLEIGPHPVLGRAVSQCLGPERRGAVFASLRRQQPEAAGLLAGAGGLYTEGHAIDWSKLCPAGRVVNLPAYPWSHRRHWIEAPATVSREAGTARAPRREGAHPLLGTRLASPLASFESHLDPAGLPLLDEHRIHGTAVLPLAACLEMALGAAREAFGAAPRAVEDLVVHEALVVPDEEGRTVQVVLIPEPDGASGFRIFGLEADDNQSSPDSWALHASGRIAPAGPVASSPAPFEGEPAGERIEAEVYYRALRGRGFGFGAASEAIQRIWRREGEAFAELRAHAGLEMEHAASALNPSLLVGCFQLAWAALPGNGDDPDPHLVTRVERFRAAAADGDRFRAHARLRAGGALDPGTHVLDVTLWDEAGRVVADVSGLTFKRASAEALLSTVRQATRDWIYDVDWVPLPPASTGSPAALPGPQAVAPAVQAELEASTSTADVTAYSQLQPELESLSLDYVLRAFDRLGVRLHRGDRVSADRVAEGRGVVPSQRRVFGRFFEMLAEEGLLRRSGSEWEVVTSLPAADAEVRRAQLLARFPAFDAELNLVGRCGERLAEVLRGECKPLDLLFPSGSLASLERLYQDSPYARLYNALVRRTVAEIAGRWHRGRKLRVLEVGGGTGGTTAHVLPVLPADRAEYTFTDVSTAFTVTAGEKFRAYPFLRSRRLDLEKDPEPQGFQGQAFDVVLAANVIHATRDLRETLRRLARLLAPGGLLVLLEVTERQRWVDLTFGLTEGWWRFSDHSLRPSHPLLSRQQWVGLLGELGFTDATAVPGDDARATLSVIVGQAALEAAAPQSRGSWLILADRGGLGQVLADRLRSAGRDCVIIASGDRYRPLEGGLVEVDIARPEQVERALAELRRVPAGLQGVLYLWGLDATATPGTSAERLAKEAARDCGSALELVRWLAAAGGNDRPRLWLVTRGAQAAELAPASIAVAQAPLWGLGRVIALEHPEVWGGLVDLDPEETGESSAERLVQEIEANGDEDQVVLRGGQRKAPRLVRSAIPRASTPWRCRPDASYLVTGGLGELGLRVARWLVEQGARHLVLVGRRGLPERASWAGLPPDGETYRRAAAVADLEALGAQVLVAAADVANEAAMAALFEEFGSSMPPLKGVVHAAAHVAFRVILQLDHEALEAMLRPKVQGTWVLHGLTRGRDLDFFVLFSSTTALWGSVRLAHYAAGNHFMDALAHHRRGLGLPALSVNWGTWDEMRGFSAEERNDVARFGLKPMASARALQALAGLISTAVPQKVVAAVDWSVLKPAYEARRRRPFLERVGGQESAAASQVREAGPRIRAELMDAAPAERQERLEVHVEREVVRILGLDPGQPVDRRRGLFEMGMDSLTSVELKRRLETGVGQPLPSTLTFNYPTIEALAGYLRTEVLGEALDGGEARPRASALSAPGSGGDPARPREPLPERDDLSEDDLTDLLAAKLRQLR